MIAVIDPAWFVRQNHLDEHAEEAMAQDVDGLLHFLSRTSAELAIVEDYWYPLWKELGGPLEARVKSDRGRSALAELRKSGRRLPVPPLVTQGRVRGCREMFGNTMIMPAEWESRMCVSLLRLAMLDRPLVLLARPVVGRNVRRHSTGNLALDESTRWRIYVQPAGFAAFRPVPCVRMRRQIDVPWTSRFDPRLPGPGDDARYPFCVPADWDDPGRRIVETRSSKPAFVDELGNGWTRPSINGGAGYHWDVFIGSVKLRERIGVDQINVTGYGNPPGEESKAGDLHHIPASKDGKIDDVGWSCHG